MVFSAKHKLLAACGQKKVIGFTVSIAFGDWGNANHEGIVTGKIIGGKVYYKNETAQGDLL